MQARPALDVVIPVRDGERYLGEALGSVLAQSPRPDRVIVADDGSTDGSAALARDAGEPVTVLRLEARGGAAALNAAIARSNAPLLAFLDADDLWLPGKLDLQLTALAEDEALEAVFGHIEEFRDPGAPAGTPRPRSGPLPGVSKTTLLIRRSALDRVGPFDESYSVTDFPEWLARARHAGLRERLLPAVVARRRVHGANMTLVRRDAAHNEYLRLARASLERRRA